MEKQIEKQMNIKSEQVIKPQPVKRVNPFEDITHLDKWLLLVTFALGYLFIQWYLFSGKGIGVTLFTIIFIVSVQGYYYLSKHQQDKMSLFWWLSIAIVGLSFSLYNQQMLLGWKLLFLILAAAYAVTFSNGRLLNKKSSDWLLIDGFNSLLAIPFSNFDAWLGGLFHKVKKETDQAELNEEKKKVKRERYSNILTIGLGLVIGIVLLLMILPLLSAADTGGFKKILSVFSQLDFHFNWSITNQLITAIFALPVMMYFYGLIVGGLKLKSRKGVTEQKMTQTLKNIKVAPYKTLLTLLVMINAVYLVFIVAQVPYYLSAFKGTIPEGYATYANYARNGFFELIRMTVINLLILVTINLVSKTAIKKNKSMVISQIILILINFFFIITALSKMLMYIDAYGMTDKRLLPCLFMLLLLEIMIGLLVRFKKEFSVTRMALITGTCLMVALSLINIDQMILSYNADRYLEESLPTFDTNLLYRADIAGIPVAIEVYEATHSEILKSDLKDYLDSMELDLFNGRYVDWNKRSLESDYRRKEIETFYENR